MDTLYISEKKEEKRKKDKNESIQAMLNKYDQKKDG